MAQKFANAARAVLAAGVGAGDTTITIVSGGSLFPVVASPDFARAVLQDATGIEIVLITAHTASADSFTVTRAQEGTTARTFAAGSVFGIRVTAADMDEAVSVTPAGSQTLTNKTFGDNPTFSAGTANAVAFLNGSKVLTSGSALTFNGTSLGVGIGAASSEGQLHLNNASGADLVLTRTNGATSGLLGRIRFGNTDVDSAMSEISSEQSGATNASNLIFSTQASGGAATEQMRLTSTGLGIGTSSPAGKLTVKTGTNENLSVLTGGSGDLRLSALNDASSSTVQLSIQGSPLYFRGVGGAINATLDTSGNLGLGVTPSAWGTAFKVLQLANGTSLSNNGQTSYYQLGANNYFDGANYRYIASNFAGFHRFSNGGAYEWHTAPSGTAGNAISFTQAMTLDASGNLGIGNTSPSSFDVQADNLVVGTGTGHNGITVFAGSSFWSSLYFADGTSGNERFRGILSYDHSVDSMLFYTSATERARITSGGDFLVGTTTSIYSASGRGVIEVNGGSTAIAALKINNTAAGYLYHDGSVLSVTNVLNGPLSFATNNTERARISAAGGFMVGTTTDPGAGLISDSVGNVRAIPPSGTRTSSYTLVKADVGDYVQVGSGGSITIPNAVFAEGDVVSVFNNTSGTVTITCSITTAYIGGADADKATMTLAARGVATILFISGTVCVVNGNVA